MHGAKILPLICKWNAKLCILSEIHGYWLQQTAFSFCPSTPFSAACRMCGDGKNCPWIPVLLFFSFFSSFFPTLEKKIVLELDSRSGLEMGRKWLSFLKLFKVQKKSTVSSALEWNQEFISGFYGEKERTPIQANQQCNGQGTFLAGRTLALHWETHLMNRLHSRPPPHFSTTTYFHPGNIIHQTILSWINW